MAVKITTQELIDNLLNAVPIEINYKDDLFLKETVGYIQYTKSSLKLVKSNNIQMYNSLKKAKENISFIDVKLDIINNFGKVKLKSLEEQYCHNICIQAINADANFADLFKDDIADKFDIFIKAVIARKKKKPSITYIEKNKQNMKLVYCDGIKPPYQFIELDALLDNIAKAVICYCNGGVDYSILNNIPTKKRGVQDKIAPAFIRCICAMICYTLLDFGNYQSIKTIGKALGDRSGVCKQIMTDLHNRCINLGYDYFAHENRLFQYDKWSIYPDVMLRKESYIAPKLPMSYLGIKEGYLGYMINKLQEQVIYKTFIDAFGGSGASSVQFKHIDGADYYINDYNYCIVSFYRVMLADNDVFEEFIDKLWYLSELYFEAYNIADGYLRSLYNNGNMIYSNAKEITRAEFYMFSDPFFDLFKQMSEFSWDITNRNNILSTPLMKCIQLRRAIHSLKGRKYKFPEEITKYVNKNIDYIDAAVLFVYYAIHNVSGSIQKNVFSDKVIYKGGYKTKDELERKFVAYRSDFNSIIVNQYGDSAMNLLRQANFNNSSTLAYIDSPYIGTVGYSVTNQSSGNLQPVKITKNNIGKDFFFTDFDMPDLLKCCFEYKGKYIFSCRENMKKSDFSGMFKPKITSNKIKLLLNNYIWFWKQWEDSSNNVLFMYDLNYTPKYLPPQVANIHNYKEFKDWDADLNDSLKKQIANFLFLCAFDGKDLEVMITNFEFKTPDFDNMYEYVNDAGYKKKMANNNIYGKRTDAIQKIPQNGLFVQMPVRLMAKIVLCAMGVFIDKI